MSSILMRKYEALVLALSIVFCIAAAPASARTSSRSHHSEPLRRLYDHRSAGHKKVLWFSAFKAPKDLTANDLENAGKAFDGFVIDFISGSKDNPLSGQNFAWEAFSNRARYTLDASDSSGDYIGDSLRALQNLPSQPMPDRFLRVNASLYDASHFDWLDDGFWDTVCANMAVAGDICSKAKLTGIFLDTEQYHEVNSPNFYDFNQLRKDPHYSGMSYQDLAAIVEKRGRQIMQALNSREPKLKVIVSFSYITVSQHETRASLSDSLLPEFLDGLLDASTPQTTFIDGFEAGYWHTNKPDFFDGWGHVIKDQDRYNFKFQKYPERYARQYQLAIGLFLDRDRDISGQNNVYGWCGDGKKELFYSPARLAYTVQQAIKASDEYVWFYSERPDAWLPPDTPRGLPSEFINAIRDGQRHGNDPSLPPLPQNTDSIAESAICH